MEFSAATRDAFKDPVLLLCVFCFVLFSLFGFKGSSSEDQSEAPQPKSAGELRLSSAAAEWRLLVTGHTKDNSVQQACTEPHKRGGHKSHRILRRASSCLVWKLKPESTIPTARFVWPKCCASAGDSCFGWGCSDVLTSTSKTTVSCCSQQPWLHLSPFCDRSTPHVATPGARTASLFLSFPSR